MCPDHGQPASHAEGASQLIDLSIITVRFNRVFANRVELMSLARQTLAPERFEIVIIDESTTGELPALIKQFQSRLHIQYRHVTEWPQTGTIHRAAVGRVSHSIHLNAALTLARGRVIMIEAGEYVHLPESLEMMMEPHQVPGQSPCVVHAQVRDLKGHLITEEQWNQDLRTLTTRTDCWGQWFAHPTHTPLYDEMACSSVRTDLLRKIGGMDETFMSGLQCEVGEVLRRLVRCGATVQFTPTLVAGHLEHPRYDRSVGPDDYRAMQRNRRLLDQGYWESNPKVKYYRPGTEKRPIVANQRRTMGIFPSEVEQWSLQETLDRLE